MMLLSMNLKEKMFPINSSIMSRGVAKSPCHFLSVSTLCEKDRADRWLEVHTHHLA